MTDLRACIEIKRDGGCLTSAQVCSAIRAAADGSAPDYQLAALLMAICIRGLEPSELVEWTRAMVESGQTLDFGGLGRPILDKHSTGGIGDKASIPLAPAVAACGGAVPMISGRGLGHTGGTLDKLESIPGLTTEVPLDRFARQLEQTGLVFAAQTPELVPADRRLYALRDQTGTVESIPLIASSILSKKLAEGLDGLVLDVKFGAGAFLPEPERGQELARTMVDLAQGFGLRAVALMTAMDRPLGRAIGHALEIRESIECLQGRGPADLRALTEALGGELLALGGLATDPQAGAAAIGEALDGGRALASLRQVVAAQGGDPRAVDDPDLLPRAPSIEVLEAPAEGRVAFSALRELGLAVVELGGGRRRLGDQIDPAVGLELRVAAGERVAAGQPWVAIHHRSGEGLEAARERCRRALAFAPLDGADPTPLVQKRIWT